jgi:endonuclease/exonuclease/phosphatase family metal-dependent hydrolase
MPVGDLNSVEIATKVGIDLANPKGRAMDISIGSFNLNNLFSRYNFKSSIQSLRASEPATDDLSVSYSFDESSDVVLRTFRGRLVKEKDPKETAAISARILAMDVDVLAVQEVEDIAVLRQFNRDWLGARYPFVILIEGNDQRLIDVGVLSKLPVGAITSFQTAVHPDAPNRPVFGRDLLGVEILDKRRRRKLLTLYNNHLKSHFVNFREDPIAGRAANDRRRQQQAEMISTLIGSRERRGGRFVLTGDMNDPVDSPFLQAMQTVDGDPLVNALADPLETRPPKAERQGPGPLTTAWSYRYNPGGRDTPPVYGLYDQIWLSAGLGDTLRSAHIDRRSKHGGDGSDHDPVWVSLAL